MLLPLRPSSNFTLTLNHKALLLALNIGNEIMKNAQQLQEAVLNVFRVAEGQELSEGSE
jgi:hypothetical protein